MSNQKIQQLIETSKEVIKSCSLEKGAIVASDSSQPDYPKEAKNYRFVWVRDASFTCLAANILKIRNIQEPFFDWCRKAEGWPETGLFYKKYSVEGKKVRHSFQPDQNGTLLLALKDYYTLKEIPARFKELMAKTADGLCNIWNKSYFQLVTEDLWEERKSFPDLKENFTYSLAACSKGLFCASEIEKNTRWKKTAQEMKTVLINSPFPFFTRSFGKLNDRRIDASLLGLVWPFEMVKADDSKIVNTIKMMENKIVRNNGVYRYENDEYDGWMYQQDIPRKKGAGYWPLLNFWMAIYYFEKGENEKALKYYLKPINDLKDKKYFPEQIFNNQIQVSVSPLCWSHAFFVIASKKLGLI